MKKLLFINLIVLMLCVLTACGSKNNSDIVDNDSQNNVNSDLTNSDSEFEMSLYSNTDDLLMKVIESSNEGDWNTYHSLLYGNFDYDKAIRLYYNCLEDIYGEGAIEQINKNMLEEYNTSDYRDAFELYFKEKGLPEYSIDDFRKIGTVPTNETNDIIEEYNNNLSSMSYASTKTFDEMGNEYGDYMYVAINSMHINVSDVDEIVHYLYLNADDIYFAKINGAWYPLIGDNITSYEHFASVMGG